jgi:hypothetical protein
MAFISDIKEETVTVVTYTVEYEDQRYDCYEFTKKGGEEFMPTIVKDEYGNNMGNTLQYKEIVNLIGEIDA